MTGYTKALIAIGVLGVAALGTFLVINSMKRTAAAQPSKVTQSNTQTVVATQTEHGGLFGFLKGIHISLA